MNIEELMIGDWVSFNDKHAQVIIIDNWENEISYFDDNAGGVLTFRNNDIEPILLTEGILLNNGFTSYGDDVAGIPAIGLVLTWDTDRWFANWGNIQIRYIHELQHLLRLVNINMDFKVK